MRNKIIGGIGILWGGAMLINWFMTDKPLEGTVNSSYRAGEYGALIWAGLMLIAGLYYFFKKPE